jgi:hypothetical protein
MTCINMDSNTSVHCNQKCYVCMNNNADIVHLLPPFVKFKDFSLQKNN